MYLNLNEILPCFGKKKIRNYAIFEYCVKWREQIKTDNFDKNKLLFHGFNKIQDY
jgi:hypothetical protein